MNQPGERHEHEGSEQLNRAITRLHESERRSAPSDARRALELFGEAILAHPATADGSYRPDRCSAALERLRPHAAPLTRLIGQGAIDLSVRAGSYRETAYPSVLYGRSGYQFLLDGDVWEVPALSQLHLDEIDEDIVDFIESLDGKDLIQVDAPANHTWWRVRPSSG